MNCPKCNSVTNQGETFCKVCGYSLNQNQQPQQLNYSQAPTWDWNVNQTTQNNNTQSTNFQNQTTNQIIQQNYSSQTRNINNSPIENNNMQNNSIIQSNNQVNIQNNNQQKQQTRPQTVFNTNYSQNIVNDDLYKEDMLIDAYIGKKADRLKNGGFSWCTFLFGTYYVLYRKMWIFGIILWVMSIVIRTVTRKLKWLDFIINLIIGMFAASLFKEKYLSHVTKKVKEIKEKNANKTHEELMAICKKKGGTTILPILLILGLIAASVGISFYQEFDIYNKAKERLEQIKNESNFNAGDKAKDNIKNSLNSSSNTKK